MKNVYFLFLALIFCLPTFAQDVNALEDFEKAIKPGTVLTYDVSLGGKKFQYIATLKKIGDEISFDWETTEAPAKKGSVNLKINSVANADAFALGFNAGAADLTKETALVLSRKMFNDISGTSQSAIKIFGASDTATVMSNTISEYNFGLNDNLVALPGWELEGGSDVKFKIQAIESYKFPLLYGLDLGWTMQLASVKSKP